MRASLVLVVPGELATLTGGYAYDRRMMQALTALGWEVAVCTLDGSFPFPTPVALRHAGEALSRLPDGTLVLLDGLALGAMPEIAERERGRLRSIALVHHPLCLESGLSPTDAAALERSERHALAAVDGIVTTSRATAAILARLAIDPAACRVAEPGTDPAPLAHGSAPGASKVRMLCVATLTPRKGYEVLFEALAPLRHLDWQLVCVGGAMREGRHAAALRARAEALGIGERVAFAGERSGPQLDAEYACADLFVLPTLYEGYGMVVAEALARGLPVVSTRTGAIPELVEPHGAGILAPPGDAYALREALERLLSDPAARYRYASGARMARLTLPTWEDAGAKLSRILEELRTVATPVPGEPA